MRLLLLGVLYFYRQENEGHVVVCTRRPAHEDGSFVSFPDVVYDGAQDLFCRSGLLSGILLYCFWLLGSYYITINPKKVHAYHEAQKHIYIYTRSIDILQQPTATAHIPEPDASRCTLLTAY